MQNSIKQANAAAPIESTPQHASRSASDLKSSALPEFSSSPVDSTAKTKPVSSRRILVVDDDRALRVILTLQLRTLGYEVVEAGNGSDAMTLCNTQQFDLIYLDMMMPVMDGVEFLTWFRGRDKNTPVVVFTSLVKHAILPRLEAAGVSKILHKPASIDEITRVTKELLEESSLEPTTAVTG